MRSEGTIPQNEKQNKNKFNENEMGKTKTSKHFPYNIFFYSLFPTANLPKSQQYINL